MKGKPYLKKMVINRIESDFMGKKKTTVEKPTMENEIDELKAKIKTLDKDSFENRVFYGFYESTKESILNIAEKLKDSKEKENNWRDYVYNRTHDQDSDLAFFITLALIESMNIPFNSVNCKMYFAFCYNLAEFFRQARS